LLKHDLAQLGIRALEKGDAGLNLLEGFLIHARSLILCAARARER
jgi:hypothetical protein